MTQITEQSRHSKGRYYPIIVISLCALYLVYKYVLQIYPSIITEQLMREYGLSAAGLGYLAGTFYYAYMFTQLVVGVLIDKYGTRYLSSMALFSCSLGILIFAKSDTLLVAALSRGMMGFGVAFATVAYMKLAAGWFPPRQYAFVGGLLATAAMAGAVFGQAPLSAVVDIMGWRDCLFLIGLIGMGLTFAFFGIVRDAPASIHHTGIVENYKIEIKDVVQVIKSKQNWLLTFYSGLAFSPIAVFGGLWGNPFLEQAYHLTKTQTASLVSIVFIGLGIGSPVIGMISDRLGHRRDVMLISTLISCAAVTLVLYCHPMPIWLLVCALFLFGFALGAFMLVFTIGKELNPPFLTATVISMINASDAFISGLTEPAIGKILDMTWDGGMVNGMRVFSMHHYHMALSVLPIYLLLAAGLLLWVKKD